MLESILIVIGMAGVGAIGYAGMKYYSIKINGATNKPTKPRKHKKSSFNKPDSPPQKNPIAAESKVNELYGPETKRTFIEHKEPKKRKRRKSRRMRKINISNIRHPYYYGVFKTKNGKWRVKIFGYRKIYTSEEEFSIAEEAALHYNKHAVKESGNPDIKLNVIQDYLPITGQQLEPKPKVKKSKIPHF